MKDPKTDNASLGTKLALRRWLLAEMKFDRVTVLDACAGGGFIWSAMKDQVQVERWIRCDVKPRQAGTLGMTATQAVRSLPLADFNVIDIDPYGEPWEPYREVLARVTRPTAMFLTHGHVMQAQVSSSNLAAVGIPSGWPVPNTPKLSAYIAQRQLEESWRFVDLGPCASVALPRVTYYALALLPRA